MKAIVWSKDGCGHCVQAKTLLESKDIAYEERNIQGGTWTREQLLEAIPTARSLPIIFIDGKLIGGLNELRKKLNK